MAFAYHMVPASTPSWIGIRHRVMDAAKVSIAFRVDRDRDAGQMSRYTLHYTERPVPSYQAVSKPDVNRFDSQREQ